VDLALLFNLLNGQFLENIEKIAVFILMLSVLIVLHEAGHFIVARLNGVRVNDFAIGFGPTLLKWTSPRSGTNYRINLLPIGGYCAMQGEDGKTNEAEQQRTARSRNDLAPDNFQAKSTRQRLAIVVAGPVANFILAYLIMFVSAITFGVGSDKLSTLVGPLSPGFPAAAAGMQMGDRIVAIDGVPYDDGSTLVDKIHSSIGKTLAVTYLHDGIRKTVKLTPRASTLLGKRVGLIGFRPMPIYQRVGPLEAARLAGVYLWIDIKGNLEGLGQLVVHPAQQAAGVTGVIGMERAAASLQDLGWAPYLDLAALISIALGIFNLLPIPALDGGRASFIVAEMIRGRPVDPEREAFVHFAGFAVLMVLMVFVAYHDVANIVSGKGVF
jgi:regulator of sigma E protease